MVEKKHQHWLLEDVGALKLAFENKEGPSKKIEKIEEIKAKLGAEKALKDATKAQIDKARLGITDIMLSKEAIDLKTGGPLYKELGKINGILIRITEAKEAGRRQGDDEKILDELSEIEKEMSKDPLLNAIYIQKGNLGAINNLETVENIEGRPKKTKKFGIREPAQLETALKKAFDGFCIIYDNFFPFEGNLLSLEAVSKWILANKIKKSHLEDLVTSMESFLAEETEEKKAAEFEKGIETLDKVLREMPEGPQKQGYVAKISKLVGKHVIPGLSTTTASQPQPEKAPEKQDRTQEIVEILLADDSLRDVIYELENLRKQVANRDRILKFDLKPKGFKDTQSFGKLIEKMKSNNDPLLRAGSREDLVAEYVKVALKFNAALVEDWDPKTSPKKVVDYFKNKWTEYLTKIKQ